MTDNGLISNIYKQFIQLNIKKTNNAGLPWWCSGEDSALPMQGARGLIPGQGTRSHMHATTKSSHATAKEPACQN